MRSLNVLPPYRDGNSADSVKWVPYPFLKIRRRNTSLEILKTGEVATLQPHCRHKAATCFDYVASAWRPCDCFVMTMWRLSGDSVLTLW